LLPPDAFAPPLPVSPPDPDEAPPLPVDDPPWPPVPPSALVAHEKADPASNARSTVFLMPDSVIMEIRL
jgi:hypothetical protein